MVAEALVPLGFTELEARLYVELLKQSPASGYRLAKAVGKAPANTYQALASLLEKGAVMVDDGVSRAFRPVPPGELLARLQRAFEARRAEAAAELARIEVPAAGDRIYQLKSVEAVYERARHMIEAAGDIILFDLFPVPFEALAGHLAAAARRGVVVAGLVYEELEADPGFIARNGRSPTPLADRWPGAQLSLVVDAQEHLVSLLSREGDRVLHGIWSDSFYLSCLQHSGLAAEIRLIDASPDDLDPQAPLGLFRSFPAGLRSLIGDAGGQGAPGTAHGDPPAPAGTRSSRKGEVPC